MSEMIEVLQKIWKAVINIQSNTDRIEQLEKDVKHNTNQLSQIIGLLSTTPSETSSNLEPLMLSERGQAFASTVAAENLVTKHYDAFLESLKKLEEQRHLRFPYDLKEACLQVACTNLESILALDDYMQIQHAAHQQGIKKLATGQAIGLVLYDKVSRGNI